MKKICLLCFLFAVLWCGNVYAGEIGFVDDPSRLPFCISQSGELTFDASGEQAYEVEVLSSVHGQLFKGYPCVKDFPPLILRLPKEEDPFLLVVNMRAEDSPFVTYIGRYIGDARIKFGSFIRVDRNNGEPATVNGVDIGGQAVIPENDGTLVFFSREAELLLPTGNTSMLSGCAAVINVEKNIPVGFEGDIGEDYVCYLFTGEQNPDAIEMDTALWDSEHANCYSYAVNLSPDVWLNGQNIQLWELMGTEEPVSERLPLKERVLYDMQLFEQTDYWTPAPEGYYKIAAYYGQTHEWDSFNEDMHFYRQNPDGTWSHKLGRSDVTVYDAGGSLIYNPQLADREERVLYNQFLGYYLVPNDLYDRYLINAPR